MLLDKFRPANGFENSVYYRSDNVIFKYVHGFEYKSNADEIGPVVDMVIILNFLDFANNCSRKVKIITISNTAHISSAFNLYLNLCTYLETTLPDLSYTEFSISLNDQNLSKKHEVMMHEMNYVKTDEYLHHMSHKYFNCNTLIGIP